MQQENQVCSQWHFVRVKAIRFGIRSVGPDALNRLGAYWTTPDFHHTETRYMHTPETSIPEDLNHIAARRSIYTLYVHWSVSCRMQNCTKTGLCVEAAVTFLWRQCVVAAATQICQVGFSCPDWLLASIHRRLIQPTARIFHSDCHMRSATRVSLSLGKSACCVYANAVNLVKLNNLNAVN